MTLEEEKPEFLCRQWTVRIDAPDGATGAGVFVAPGLVLTSAHVVKAAHEQRREVTILWQEQSFFATIDLYDGPAYPDLALLGLPFRLHPFCDIDPSVNLNDLLFSIGFPKAHPQGDSLTLYYEGSTNPPQVLMKLKGGQVVPGFSGAPLLNTRTNRVCGIIKATRDQHSDIGGRAIPAELILDFVGIRPGLRTGHGNSHNPFRAGSRDLIGRENEIAHLLNRLHAPDHCSLVGPAYHSGKTMIVNSLVLRAPKELNLSPGQVVYLPCRTIRRIADFKNSLAKKLGGMGGRDLEQQIEEKGLKVLILDDLGSTPVRGEGPDLRRLIRGLSEHYAFSLVMVSNSPLSDIFSAETTRADSPLSNLVPHFDLGPLSIEHCRSLIVSRLHGTGISPELFFNQCDAPRQPRRLLRDCANQYDRLFYGGGLSFNE